MADLIVPGMCRKALLLEHMPSPLKHIATGYAVRRTGFPDMLPETTNNLLITPLGIFAQRFTEKVLIHKFLPEPVSTIFVHFFHSSLSNSNAPDVRPTLWSGEQNELTVLRDGLSVYPPAFHQVAFYPFEPPGLVGCIVKLSKIKSPVITTLMQVKSLKRSLNAFPLNSRTSGLKVVEKDTGDG